MRAALRFAGWASLAFAVSWWIATPYQHAIVAIACRVASVTPVDMEVFYPFDLGIYVALCLASSWARWRARRRALAIGLPVLVVVEVLTLVVAMRVIVAADGGPPAGMEAAQRFAIAAIRATGLVAAGCAWVWLLAREPMLRLVESLAAPARGAGTTQRRRS